MRVFKNPLKRKGFAYIVSRLKNFKNVIFTVNKIVHLKVSLIEFWKDFNQEKYSGKGCSQDNINLVLASVAEEYPGVNFELSEITKWDM